MTEPERVVLYRIVFRGHNPEADAKYRWETTRDGTHPRVAPPYYVESQSFVPETQESRDGLREALERIATESTAAGSIARAALDATPDGEVSA